MSITNAQEANEALEESTLAAEQQQAEQAELEETRAAMEGRRPAGSEQQQVSEADPPAARDEIPEFVHEQIEAADPYELTHRRRAGTVQLSSDDETYHGFAKPRSWAGQEMLRPIEEAEEEGGDGGELMGYVQATLAEWSLDPDKDAIYWADELALLEAIRMTRGLAYGGNL